MAAHPIVSPAPTAAPRPGPGLASLATRVRRSPWLLPLAALATALVVGVNEASYHDARAALAGIGAHHEAGTQVRTLLRRLADAESEQRGYLLTGRAEYLAPYEQSVKEVGTTLQLLMRHDGSDPVRAAVVARLAERSREKLSELGTAIELHDAGRHDSWRAQLMSDVGRQKMEAVRQSAASLLESDSARERPAAAGLSGRLDLARAGVNALAVIGLLALFLFLRRSRSDEAVQCQLAASLQSERERLEADAGHRTAELTELAKHLHNAREDERSSLARELHNELGALLTAAKLEAARLKRSLGMLSPEHDERLKHLNEMINKGIGLKRRIIEDLRPSALNNLGLVAALEILAGEFTTRSAIELVIELEPVAMSEGCQITVYRLVQESLANVAAHAGAATVSVRLRRDGDRAHVQVQDDGRGFDSAVQRGSANGLMGLRYRLEAAEGLLRVISAPGKGTLVEAWVPAQPDPVAA